MRYILRVDRPMKEDKIRSFLSICAICIILCVILFPGLSAFAEDKSERKYWLDKYGETEKNEFSQRANEVFHRVLAASDRRVGVEPALYIINYDGLPWAQSLADGSVMVTRKALQFCYTNHSPGEGDSRFAFVIGHELAHQFNGDFWHYKFLRKAGEESGGIQTFQDVKEVAKDPDMLAARELQADQYGVIYAALAGYNTDAIISRDKNFFLEWVEKETPHLGLSENRLLSVKKRSQAVYLRLREASEKVILFELGVISYHLGRYDDSLGLFKRFASYFPGREVYSNIGTIYLRMAYDEFIQSRSSESFPFLLSFGIDINSRAEAISISRGFNEDKYQEYKRNARTAIEHLSKAIEYDPYYQEAKNSLGCAYMINGQYYESVSMLEEALKLTPDNWRVQNNLAVAYYMLGQTIESSALRQKAEKMLEAAGGHFGPAKVNLNRILVLEKKKAPSSLSSGIAHEESNEEVFIDFKPSFGFKPGTQIPKDTTLELIDEFSENGEEVRKVFRNLGQEIFLLTKQRNIRLILYRKPKTLQTDNRGGEEKRVSISQRGRNGLIHSRDKGTDYFEY